MLAVLTGNPDPGKRPGIAVNTVTRFEISKAYSEPTRYVPNFAILRGVHLVAGDQIKAKALKRAVDIGRPSIPPQQLQGLWAMAQDNPEAIAQRFGAPKVCTRMVCMMVSGVSRRKWMGFPQASEKATCTGLSWTDLLVV